MERNIDNVMSRICTRIMSAAQNALEAICYALEEMEYAAEANPDREDIRACIDEIKATNKANESANWAAANHWGEHFDGIGAPEEEAEETAEETEENAESGEDEEEE